MAKEYKAFTITGVANDTTFDGGLQSTEAEPKKLLGLLLHVTGWIGNIIGVDIERKTIATIYDYHLQTDESTGDTNTQKNNNRDAFIDLPRDIPIGQTLSVSIQCGATAKNVHGSYVYDVTK